MEFIDTARRLEIETIRFVVTFPKRYTFYISQQTANLTTDIYNLVKKGNSIYPTNAHESQMRLDCFIEARALIQCLNSQLEVIRYLFPVNLTTFKTIITLMDQEDRLLKGVIQKERKRQRDFTE